MADYLILFEDCRVVRGYNRSIIYDLTRPSNSNFIPNSMSDILSELKNNSIISVLNNYKTEEKVIINEYIEFLVENEFAIVGDKYLKQHLTEITFEDYTPGRIENSIICMNQVNFQKVTEIIKELNIELCERLEFRIENLIFQQYETLVDLIKESDFKSILIRSRELNIDFFDSIEELINEEPRILKHHVYGTSTNRDSIKTSYYKQDVNFILDCGITLKNDFSINRQFFISSNCQNTCLSKKVSVNFKGEVCNCPSIEPSKKNYTIKEFINSPEYKENSLIKKDQIEICQDCEFRHMCLDCRAFTDSKTRKHSRPKNCSYNPYISKWKNEKDYYDLDECGVKSNESEFHIDFSLVSTFIQK